VQRAPATLPGAARSAHLASEAGIADNTPAPTGDAASRRIPFMRNQVVTVFGGTGFIGRQLVQHLAGLGAALRVPTRDPDRAGFLRPMGDVGQIAILPASADPEGVARLVHGTAAAVNLVGILHERRDGDFLKVHRDFAGTVAIAAKAAGTRRLVHLSAIGADPDGAARYARSKGEGEAAVRRACPEATILRPSIVFGPGDGFFTRFARMSMLSPVLPLIEGGRTRFQPVYVGDVVEAIATCLADDVGRGKTFELGGPRIASFEELLRYLLATLHRRRLLLPVPARLAAFQARFLEYLPSPPLTRDQIRLLQKDNVVAPGALTLADLGIEPTPLETVVPRYLAPFKRQQPRLRPA
jgi:NADH dehydrogenase